MLKEVSVMEILMVGILRHINCFGDGMVLGIWEGFIEGLDFGDDL